MAIVKAAERVEREMDGVTIFCKMKSNFLAAWSKDSVSNFESCQKRGTQNEGLPQPAYEGECPNDPSKSRPRFGATIACTGART